MQKKQLLSNVLVITAISLVVLGLTLAEACKKNNKSVNNDATTKLKTEIEYELNPISNTLVKISYTTARRVDTSISDYDSFPVSGKQKIVVDSLPFLAKFSTVANNPFSVPVNFDLRIYVNGEIKKFKSVSVPAASTGWTSEIEFLVE